jgi:hypothetical protein
MEIVSRRSEHFATKLDSRNSVCQRTDIAVCSIQGDDRARTVGVIQYCKNG